MWVVFLNFRTFVWSSMSGERWLEVQMGHFFSRESCVWITAAAGDSSRHRSKKQTAYEPGCRVGDRTDRQRDRQTNTNTDTQTWKHLQLMGGGMHSDGTVLAVLLLTTVTVWFCICSALKICSCGLDWKGNCQLNSRFMCYFYFMCKGSVIDHMTWAIYMSVSELCNSSNYQINIKIMWPY